MRCRAPAKWRGPELNRRHHDFQSCALPTELPRRGANILALREWTWFVPGWPRSGCRPRRRRGSAPEAARVGVRGPGAGRALGGPGAALAGAGADPRGGARGGPGAHVDGARDAAPDRARRTGPGCTRCAPRASCRGWSGRWSSAATLDMARGMLDDLLELVAERAAERAALLERLAERGHAELGRRPVNVLLPWVALQGLAVGTADGRWVAQRPPDPVDEEEALATMGRRYLEGYGPAGDRDLAAWSGLPLGRARRALELAGPVDAAGPGRAAGVRAAGGVRPGDAGLGDARAGWWRRAARDVLPGGGMLGRWCWRASAWPARGAGAGRSSPGSAPNRRRTRWRPRSRT